MTKATNPYGTMPLPSTTRLKLEQVLHELSEPSRRAIIEGVRQFAVAKMEHPKSALVLGAPWKKIYDACEPYTGTFRSICACFEGSFSERTAYRYMETWKNCKEFFPSLIFEEALCCGLEITSVHTKGKDEPLGKFSEAVRQLPPPKNPTPAKAKEYVAKLQQLQKEIGR